ncbi:replication factor C subunit 1 [Pancytospora philotis]|nr:replication factor C subunit 1 [Pancytospora philotis]
MAEKCPLDGYVFVFTGEMKMPRDEARRMATTLGARVTTSISGKTTHLVAGAEPGAAKIEKARGLGLKVLDEDKFTTLVERARPALSGVISTTINSASPSPVRASNAVSSSEYTDSCDFSAHSEQRNTEAPARSQPWSEKYRPKTRGELLGNASAVAQLDEYLRGVSQSKAALLSGPPGVGKTSTAHLLCALNGLEAIEFNASDLRNKSSLAEMVGALSDSRTISRDLTVQSRVLIMDEVDGMSSDRGGIPELIGIIKRAKMPIICICNDRSHPKMRTLAGHCLDVRFRKLDARTVLPRVKEILRAEQKSLADHVLNEVIASCNSDMRYILNTLQSLVAREQVAAQGLFGSLTSKNQARGPFELTTDLFSRRKISDKIDAYFEDYAFLPLFVHENYTHCRMELAALQRAAESISLADMHDTYIHGAEQDWSLMPHHAFLSCVYPTRGLALNTRIDFPGYFGQMSRLRKHQRILGEVQARCAYRMERHELSNYALYILDQQFMACLRQDDLKACVDLIVQTGLLKDDFVELNAMLGGTFKSIPAKTKNALTRECKKINRVLTYVAPKEQDDSASDDE